MKKAVRERGDQGTLARRRRAAKGAVEIARFEANDDVIPLRIVAGEAAEAGALVRHLAKPEIPLCTPHLLDHVVPDQGGDHVAGRAVEILVGRAVAALPADIEALPVDSG